MIAEIDLDTNGVTFKRFLNSGNHLPSMVEERIQRECGHFILVDEILHSEGCGARTRQMALELLERDNDDRIMIKPSKLENSLKFIENILHEASKNSSRYALELTASMNSLIDELFSNLYISENVLTNFIRNFRRFTRYFLATKLNQGSCA